MERSRAAKHAFTPQVWSGKPGHRVRRVNLCRPLTSYHRTLQTCPPLRFLRLRETDSDIFVLWIIAGWGRFAGGRKRDSGRTAGDWFTRGRGFAYRAQASRFRRLRDCRANTRNAGDYSRKS